MASSIAITGANGRLGTRFLSDPAWRDRHELAAFSRVSDGESTRECGALCDPEVIAGFDFLLHLAWSTVPKTAQENPGRTDAIDLPLLEQILESAVIGSTQRDRPIHLIFFSTGAVYGNALHDSGSVESDPPTPIGAYARGKWEAEKLIGRYVDERNLRATVLRVSNAWGFPGHAGTPQGVIPNLIRCSLDGSIFEQWGGDSEKDYLHVDDLSRALLTVFDQQPEGPLFNVAAGRSHRLSDVMRIVERIAGTPIKSMPGNPLEWDVSENRLSPKLFCEATGWTPSVEFDAGISRLVEEMR